MNTQQLHETASDDEIEDGANSLVRLNAVHRFLDAIVNAAVDDEHGDVPEYCVGRNRGKDLVSRLGLATYRTNPRHGDSTEARRIYMAVRFLYRTEGKD